MWRTVLRVISQKLVPQHADKKLKEGKKRMLQLWTQLKELLTTDQATSIKLVVSRGP